MKARNFLFSVLILTVSNGVAFPQEVGSGLAVIKFSWERERIRPRPSVSPLASQEELIQQSRRERDLAAARNSADKGRAGQIETQMVNHQEATAKARNTSLPRDGYRYVVTLRNDGGKTIKSIDWDYVFIDPITQQQVARHQFTSDETIKPGKRKEVAVLYLIQPVKTVSARILNKKDQMPFTEHVVVAHITYSDGSVWERPD
jgi:hypothetical protein